MNTDSLPLQALCAVAIEAARAAGQAIQRVDRDSIARRFKDAGTTPASQLVTDVDIRSEAIIRETLEVTTRKWDITFIGEESIEDNQAGRFETSCFWCVDPLDGTLPFAEGRDGYAVSIALVDRSGLPLIGVVYDPVEDSVLSAVKGQGAKRDGAAFATRVSTSSSLQVYADASFAADVARGPVLEALERCARLAGLAAVDIHYGSGAVKNACQVLDHPSACYLKLPKSEDGGGSLWDFAATAGIAVEAGGWASNVQGLPLDLNRRDSTFMNHQGVLYASNPDIAGYLIESLGSGSS